MQNREQAELTTQDCLKELVLGGQRLAGQTILVLQKGISLLEMDRNIAAISTQKALLVT